MKQKFTKGEKAYLQMPVEVKSIDKELGTLEAIFSTQDVDRHGDIILQDGWDISMFKKNPVILNSHNYGDAAEVIGKASNVKVEGKKLVGKITFAVNENPKAKVIFDLYSGGFLNAFSVGFIPTAFKTNKDGSTDWYTIESAELLEVSAVSVPANARALAKAKGIDIDMLKSNDDEEHKPTNEDEGGEQKPEGDADALPKGDEVPPADGDAPAGDGDGGQGEPAKGDEEAGSDAGAPTGDEVIPEEAEADAEPEAGAEEEVTPESPVQASYASKVVKAIANIDSRQREELKRAAKIIKSILDGDVEGTRVEAKVQDQIQKRKINQAIRSLMKVR
jgi:HK97 family phage prohead protease